MYCVLRKYVLSWYNINGCLGVTDDLRFFPPSISCLMQLNHILWLCNCNQRYYTGTQSAIILGWERVLSIYINLTISFLIVIWVVTCDLVVMERKIWGYVAVLSVTLAGCAFFQFFSSSQFRQNVLFSLLGEDLFICIMLRSSLF